MPQGQAWWWEQLHPDDQEGDKFDVEEAVGSGRSIVREYRVRHKDGRWLDVEDRAMLLRDDAGKPVKMVGCTVDVTERKRAEEALRQKVEEIRTLLDTLPIGAFIAHDPECHRITGNRAAHDLLGIPPDHNLSKTAPASEQPTHFRVCRNGVEIPAEQLPVQRAARGEQIRNEEVDDIFDDGTVLHTLMSAAPLLDEQGRCRGAVASVLDVTELKQIEQLLRDSEERYRATVEHAAVGVGNCAPDGRFVYANRKYCEIVGYSLEELLEKTWQELTGDRTRTSGGRRRRVQLSHGQAGGPRRSRELPGRPGFSHLPDWLTAPAVMSSGRSELPRSGEGSLPKTDCISIPPSPYCNSTRRRSPVRTRPRCRTSSAVRPSTVRRPSAAGRGGGRGPRRTGTCRPPPGGRGPRQPRPWPQLAPHSTDRAAIRHGIDSPPLLCDHDVRVRVHREDARMHRVPMAAANRPRRRPSS